MNQKADHRLINQAYFQASRVFYQRGFNGHGEGWYFMLSDNHPYGPFSNMEAASTSLEAIVKCLSDGEFQEGGQHQG